MLVAVALFIVSITKMTSPDSISERHWLAEGLQEGYLRTEVGVEIMKLLDRTHERLKDTISPDEL